MSSMNLSPPSSGSIFKMKVAGSLEIFVTVYQTIRRHIPEYLNLSFESCKNSMCYKIYVIFQAQEIRGPGS